MAAAEMGPDLITLRDLILTDETALHKWSAIVDHIAPTAEDRVRCKQMIKRHEYSEAILTSLYCWYSNGQTVDLFQILRAHGLKALVDYILEQMDTGSLTKIIEGACKKELNASSSSSWKSSTSISGLTPVFGDAGGSPVSARSQRRPTSYQTFHSLPRGFSQPTLMPDSFQPRTPSAPVQSRWTSEPKLAYFVHSSAGGSPLPQQAFGSRDAHQCSNISRKKLRENLAVLETLFMNVLHTGDIFGRVHSNCIQKEPSLASSTDSLLYNLPGSRGGGECELLHSTPFDKPSNPQDKRCYSDRSVSEPQLPSLHHQFGSSGRGSGICGTPLIYGYGESDENLKIEVDQLLEKMWTATRKIMNTNSRLDSPNNIGSSFQFYQSLVEEGRDSGVLGSGSLTHRVSFSTTPPNSPCAAGSLQNIHYDVETESLENHSRVRMVRSDPSSSSSYLYGSQFEQVCVDMEAKPISFVAVPCSPLGKTTATSCAVTGHSTNDISSIWQSSGRRSSLHHPPTFASRDVIGGEEDYELEKNLSNLIPALSESKVSREEDLPIKKVNDNFIQKLWRRYKSGELLHRKETTGEERHESQHNARKEQTENREILKEGTNSSPVKSTPSRGRGSPQSKPLTRSAEEQQMPKHQRVWKAENHCSTLSKCGHEKVKRRRLPALAPTSHSTARKGWGSFISLPKFGPFTKNGFNFRNSGLSLCGAGVESDDAEPCTLSSTQTQHPVNVNTDSKRIRGPTKRTSASCSYINVRRSSVTVTQKCQKSNRHLILNAMEHSIYPGQVNYGNRDESLQFRGLYAVKEGLHEERIVKLCGAGPRLIKEEMFDLFYKYNSGSKRFMRVNVTQLTVNVDGFTIRSTLWQGKKSSVN